MSANNNQPNLFNPNHILIVDEFDFWIIQQLSVREARHLEYVLSTAARLFGSQANDIILKNKWMKPNCPGLKLG